MAMRIFPSIQRRTRRGGGAVFVISAFLLIALLGITGLVFDVGQIKVLRTQLQAGADAATLAAARELVSGLGPYASRTPAEAEAAARAVAVQYAAFHRSGDLNSAYIDPNRDVNFGHATYNKATNTWTLDWGGTPVNMVRVNLLRNQAASANGDGPLPLVFGTLFQKLTADVRAYATAAVLPGYRFEIPPESGYCCGIIPFALDQETWKLVSGKFDQNNQDMVALYNSLPDDYKHHGDETVTNGSDGKKEGDLYPYFNDPVLPNAGNRGTVDIGFHGNSTQEIKGQVVTGVCEVDLSAQSNLYASEDEPLTLNGDTGLSAGFANELIAIIGKTKMVPVFASTNPLSGNNADFEIVEWAPIVILDVDLSNKPEDQHIYFQPATVSDECVVVDLDGEITEETSIFAKPVLIE